MSHIIRRLDVMSRRRIRQAVVAWYTFACKASMFATRVACSLPSDRRTQDRAMYSVAAIGAAVALHVAVYRG